VACVEAVRDEDDPWFLSRGLDTLGAALAAAHVPVPAAEFLGAAAALRRRAGVRLHRSDEPVQGGAVATACAALGGAAFDAAWTAGEALAPDALFARVAALGARPVGTAATAGEAPSLAAAISAAPSSGTPELDGAQAIAARAVAVEGPATPAVEVLAFGPLAVMRGGVPLGAGELTPAKARELLLYLVLHPSRTKEQIALDLWPEASEARVRGAFHVALHHLRRILGRKEAVTFDGGAYALTRPGPDGRGAGAHGRAGGHAPALACDVDAVLAAAAALRAADRAAERAGARGPAAVAAAGADVAAIAAWSRALDQAQRGALGEGTKAGDWLVAHQNRLRAAWGDALEALARLHARRGTPVAAAATLETLVAADPLRETAHRALMACYAAAGEPTRALAHYDALADTLASDLGAIPARETRALAEAIRRGTG
jgi:DNA-binding SARP family transcriptional activator